MYLQMSSCKDFRNKTLGVTWVPYSWGIMLDIQLKRGNFFRSVNVFCVKFNSVLFQTYCCSFYGGQLWIGYQFETGLNP